MASYTHFAVLTLLFPLLLSACGLPAGLTPETAAIGFLTNEHQAFGLEAIEPFSIDILHKQPFKEQFEHILLLIAFRGKDSADNRVECIALFDSYQDTNKTWSAIGHGNCRLLETAALRPRLKRAGVAFLVEPDGPLIYSYAFERLWDEGIETITITWEDDFTQVASLNKNVYLAVREGEFAHTLVEGKDETGQVVYSETVPVPPK